MTFDPILLLAMWSAGISAAAAAVAWWRVVGPGFLWLTGGVVVLVGLAVGFDSPLAIGALVLALGGVVLARRPPLAAGAFALAAFGFLAVAALRDGIVPAVAGSLALGGITGEMLLGHWYLVDPRLPRWALYRLDAAGGVGIVAEVGVAIARGTVAQQRGLFAAAFFGLALLTLLLAVGVWFSLREKGYEGVMAATGLSYLATLTVLAVAFLARTPVGFLIG